MSTDRTCSVIENGEPCTEPHRARGWCYKHYLRWKKHGDPLKGARIEHTVCTIVEYGEPCGRPHYAHGWCTMHHARWTRHGDPIFRKGERIGPPDRCPIVENGERCFGLVKAKDMCSKHYTRANKYGDPLAVRKKPKKAKKQCSVVEHGEQCTRPVTAKEMCSKHHTRWRRHGDPLKTGRPAQDFVQEVLTMEPTDECILWPFAKYPSGYGMIGVAGKSPRPAHNHILRLAAGDPEPGQEACHAPHDVCGDRSCVNPRHLRWATRKQNLADRERDQTDHKGERHPHAKLTEADILAIRSDTRPYKQIAETYDLHKVYVGKIKRLEAWKHVKS